MDSNIYIRNKVNEYIDEENHKKIKYYNIYNYKNTDYYILGLFIIMFLIYLFAVINNYN
jgi:hypothetical protein